METNHPNLVPSEPRSGRDCLQCSEEVPLSSVVLVREETLFAPSSIIITDTLVSFTRVSRHLMGEELE